MSIKKEDQATTAKLINWMANELPKKFEDLVSRKSIAGTSLRKRSKEEDAQTDQSKLSIKDRIKVREDAKDKKIKVAAVPLEKIEEKIKIEGEETDKAKKDPAKVRCSFWPGCKKPECWFAHPKEVVS